jgi:hypothetical protein
MRIPEYDITGRKAFDTLFPAQKPGVATNISGIAAHRRAATRSAYAAYDSAAHSDGGTSSTASSRGLCSSGQAQCAPQPGTNAVPGPGQG